MITSNRHILMVTTLFPSEEKPYYCVFLRQLFESLQQIGCRISILMPDATLPEGELVQTQQSGFYTIRIGQNGNIFYSVAGKTSKDFSVSVKQVLRDVRPDAIDIHFASDGACKAIVAAAKELGIPAIIHYHGLNIYRDYYVAHPILERLLRRHKVWIANHADGIVGVSDKTGQIVRTKTKNKNIYTVYNGVDPARFFPAERKDNAVFTIVCVANLIPIKGHAYLLRAVHRVCSEHGQPLRVRIIGNGPAKPELQRMTVELGLEDTVKFLGEKTYDEVAWEIRSADFFIMPSYFEALGCVYLEAMASGVAVLGVNGCGIDELIADRQNGYLVDPQNAEQIADCILYAIENPQDHKKIAVNGYDTVLNGYLWKHAAAALDQVYQDFIHRSTDNEAL